MAEEVLTQVYFAESVALWPKVDALLIRINPQQRGWIVVD
jgi:hypothetical protein